MLGTTNVKVKPNKKVDYVEYIESTGTQYIDTGVCPYKTKIEITFQYTGLKGAGECYVAGAQDSTSTRYIPMQYMGKTDYYIFRSIDKAGNSTVLGNYDNNIHTVLYNDENNGVYFDGELKKTFTSLLSQNINSIYLFALNNASSVEGFVSCRIMNVKITDKETGKLVRDFKPCKDGAGVYCLYDEIEKRYYYNQGTGKFYGNGYVEPIPSNTKLLMHFEENLVDATGLNTTNLISNTATYTDGKFGKAIYLPENEYVSIPLTSETTLGTGDFTIAGWFNIEDTSKSRCLWSFAHYVSSGAGYQGIQVWYNGKLSFCCDLAASGKNRKDTTKTLSLNTWYHIALVRYNGTVTLYVDGTSVGSLNASGTVYQNTNNDWKIGASSSQPSYPIRETFKGKIDEFIIAKKAVWVSNFTPPSFSYGGEA